MAQNEQVCVHNVTRQADLATRAQVAASFWPRLRGLIGRRAIEPGGGLVLRRCNAIHMAFMRFALDVIYLSAQGRVVAVDHALAPWRVGRVHRQAADVVELPAGTLAATATAVGDQVSIAPS